MLFFSKYFEEISHKHTEKQKLQPNHLKLILFVKLKILMLFGQCYKQH